MKIDNTLAAIVTGGASGLGLASVRALRAAGVKVAIFDLNEADGVATSAHPPKRSNAGCWASRWRATAWRRSPR